MRCSRIQWNSLWAAAALFSLFPATAAEPSGSLKWKEKNVAIEADFGQERVHAYYTFVNTSDGPITITATEASCGCTVPSLEKETYGPGESGKLLAEFDIGSRVGEQFKEIMVETIEPDGVHSYTLQLNVDIPQLLQLKRRALLWKTGETPEAKDCEILIHARRPMAIDGIEFRGKEQGSDAFDFEIVEIEPNHLYRLVITPKSTEEKIRETCYLTSPDDKEKLLRNFPIYAWIR